MTVDQRVSPYKGLRVFEDSDLDVPFFFGREHERRLIEANLMASRLTVLYGVTGVGKSSVLRAGVAHHLRSVGRANLDARGEPELAVVVFDDWRGDPVDVLRQAVAEEVTRALGGTPHAVEEQGTLLDSLRSWSELLGGDVYVIFDQVEEYFLYHRDEEGPGVFADAFPEVVGAPDLRVNFLLAIREDAVAKLDAFKARIPNVLGNYVRLEHLDRQAARAAIVKPIARYNELVEDARVDIEPALVEAVLDQVACGRVDVGQAGRGAVDGDGDAKRIETPYLQLVMQRLWEEEQERASRVLRLETLMELGGAERIVGDHVERALAALTPIERDLAAVMFDHLVTPSGTKIAHQAGDLARYAGAQRPSVVAVLDKLGGDRIVRSIANGDASGARYEIFHDVLAQPVLAWKAAHDANRELERQGAEAERRHRRLIRLLALASAVVLAMAGVTIFALTQRGEARSQARVAKARELAATAAAQLQVDPELSLALAVQSARLKATKQGEDVLRQALIAARELAVLPARRPVRIVSFNPEGSLVLAAGDDGVARIWRPSGKMVRTLRQRGPLTAAAFSPNGTIVLTAGRDGVRLWRADTGTSVVAIHQADVTSATFSGDGRVVLTTGMDGKARLWSARTGAELLAIDHGRPVLRGAISADGSRLVTVSSDRTGLALRARLFALPGGRLVRELATTGVSTASFSASGARLVTGSLDHTAAIWDATTGQLVHPLLGHQGAITAALFGPRGRLVVTTSSDGSTRVWNATTGAFVALLLGHANAVTSASFSRDGKLLVTTSSDGTARVWDANSGELNAVLRGHTDTVGAAAFGPDGRTVVTGSADRTARIWDPGIPLLDVLATEPASVQAASTSRDNRLVVTAGEDGTARILTSRGSTLHVLRHPGPVASAIFSPDGRYVFTSAADRAVRVWRSTTGALLRTVPGISDGRLAVSRDGRLLAAPTASGSLGIWDTTTFRLLRELLRGAPFTAAAFGPDGRLLATAGADDTARLWNRASGVLLRTLRGHLDALTDVEFSADGALLATASRDHDARIWDVRTGRMTKILRGHFGPVFGASFSPDGQWLVTAGPITAGLWPVSTGRLLFFIRGHTGPLTGASFTPDGRRILTSSRDGTVRVYTCDLCGGISGLMAAADARLAALARPLAPAQRERYVPRGDTG